MFPLHFSKNTHNESSVFVANLKTSKLGGSNCLNESSRVITDGMVPSGKSSE